MTRAKLDAEEAFDEETRKRLKELGYMEGGYVYEFLTLRRNLDLILDDIEAETDLRFRGGEDGHASLGGNVLRITSKKEVPKSKVKDIEGVI